MPALTLGLACDAASPGSSSTTLGAGGAPMQLGFGGGGSQGTGGATGIGGFGGIGASSGAGGGPVTPKAGSFCALPGSVVFGPNGTRRTIGAAATPDDLAWLEMPAGFCAHYFGSVGNARQVRVAPGGEVFVASPTAGTTGGGTNGASAIVYWADDNHDGIGEGPVEFLRDLPSTQGILFTGGYVYYQDGTRVVRRPYAAGQRTPHGPAETLVDISFYASSTHWPKVLDVALDGTIYVTNGGDQDETCRQPMPFHGGVLALGGASGAKQIAKGMRNPIALRCRRDKNVCYAAELDKDYSADEGGREKLVPIEMGDDWGFPCCSTRGVPFPDGSGADCSHVATETVSFVIAETPFGFDFEPGTWASPWGSRVFVAMHGAFGTWQGARITTVATDPVTGAPVAASDLPGANPGAFANFALGWDDGKNDHGRPSDVTFADDGRMFIANDSTGEILWVAPVDLPAK